VESRHPLPVGDDLHVLAEPHLGAVFSDGGELEVGRCFPEFRLLGIKLRDGLAEVGADQFEVVLAEQFG
jgi:hypothetical protein